MARIDEHPGKVRIWSASPDALKVLGGGVFTGGMTSYATGSWVADALAVAQIIRGRVGDGIGQIHFKDQSGAILYHILQGDGSGLKFFNSSSTQLFGISQSQALVADGTASVPSLSFIADGNTGMYRNAEDVIGFTCAAVPSAYIAQGLITARAITSANGPGGILMSERNTFGGGAPGQVRLDAKNGTQYFIYPDSAGLLRIHTGAPTQVSGDLVGTIVGEQSSSRAVKDIVQQERDTASALATIKRTPVYHFYYKDRRYNGEMFTGIVTEDSPEFGMDQGRAFNPVTAFGYSVLAMQELAKQNQALEARVAALEATIAKLTEAR